MSRAAERCGPVGIELHHRRAVSGQPIDQRRLGHKCIHIGVLEHEGEALRRIGGIERQIGAAGLEDAKQPDQQFQRTLDAQPDDRLRSKPTSADDARADWPRIELPIGEVSFVEHHRDGVGRPGHLCGEQLRQGGGRNRPRGVVPLAQDGVALRGGQNVQAADRPVGSATAASSRRIRRRQRLSTLARSNRSVAYSRTRRFPPARRRARCSLRLTDRSNLAVAVATG